MVYKEGFLDPKIQIEFNSKHLITIAPYSFGMLTLVPGWSPYNYNGLKQFQVSHLDKTLFKEDCLFIVFLSQERGSISKNPPVEYSLLIG